MVNVSKERRVCNTELLTQYSSV